MNEDRRSFLKITGTLALGAGLFGAGAAAGRATQQGPAPKKYDFVLPKVSADRVLRTQVGLRPHRPIGFRLESEALEGKTIIHNYGHGGAGWSLSWGTGHMAAEMVEATGAQDCAVLGSGIVGLAAARLLQRRGKTVTIYARELPPRVTSNYATAGWSPTATLCEPAKISPEFKVAFEKAARLGHRYWQDFMNLPAYGVHMAHSVRFRESAGLAGEAAQQADPGFYGNLIQDLMPEPHDLTPDQHGLPFPYATLSSRMHFETHTFLNATMRDFAAHGGKFVIREFKSLDDVLAVPGKTIVNCLGVGAKQVCNDEPLMPIRGQVTVLAPQADLAYAMGFEGFSATPRYDGVAVGNTMIMGEWSTTPDLAEAKRVVDGLREMVDRISRSA